MALDVSFPMPGIVYTHNNSLDNILRGLGERLFRVQVDGNFVPCPRPVVFDCGDYANKVLSKMPKFSEPISRDEFVCLYDGAKRKRYEAAVKHLAEFPLTPRDSEINVFIKDEKICSWTKVDPACRLISPRTPEYCVELGRFIKPIEHLLYKAVARVWGETTIFKGLNFNQRGEELRRKWDSYTNPVAVGLDASRFDQHVSVEALRWEHSIYRGCYPRNKSLRKLLERQLFNEGSCYVDDHKVTYAVKGGRMSGDMNTALGNCLIMTGMVWHYLQQKGIKASLANDGDDCVVIMEQADLDRFMEGLSEFFLRLGFNMKVEKPCFEFEEIEFCQCHPVFNGESWSMCRNVTKALFTDIVHIGRSIDEIRSIRFATAQCGLVWSKGFPIFQAFYNTLMKTGVRGKKEVSIQHSGTYWNSKGCSSGTEHITEEARLSFYRAFGITPSEQLAIEQYYESLPVSVVDSKESQLTYDPLVSPSEYPIKFSESLNLLLF